MKDLRKDLNDFMNWYAINSDQLHILYDSEIVIELYLKTFNTK